MSQFERSLSQAAGDSPSHHEETALPYAEGILCARQSSGSGGVDSLAGGEMDGLGECVAAVPGQTSIVEAVAAAQQQANGAGDHHGGS